MVLGEESQLNGMRFLLGETIGQLNTQLTRWRCLLVVKDLPYAWNKPTFGPPILSYLDLQEASLFLVYGRYITNYHDMSRLKWLDKPAYKISEQHLIGFINPRCDFHHG